MSDERPRKPESTPGRWRISIALLFWLAVPFGVAVAFAVAGSLPWGLAVAIAVACPVIAVPVYYFTRSILAVEAIAIVLSVILTLAAPVLQEARRPVAPRGGYPSCRTHLKLLGLALHSYHDVHGCFPPAVLTDETGRPMHSWRVLMLPYFEQGGLYAQYRLDEPWNGPNNRKLHDTTLSDLLCVQYAGDPEAVTTYVAVIGPNTAWRVNESISLDDITDGPSSTILVVEVADSDFPWIEPRDLHVLQMAPGINPEEGQGISSHHRDGGVNVLFADGTVRTLPNDTPPEKIEAMLTIAGGEQVELDDW